MRRSQELWKNFKDKNVLELSKVSAFNHTRRKNKVHQIRDDLLHIYLEKEFVDNLMDDFRHFFLELIWQISIYFKSIFFLLLLYFRSFIFMAPMEQNSMEQIFLALGNPLARMKNGTTPPPLIIPIWMLRNWKNESSDLNQITLLDLIFPEPACSGKINFIFIILFVLEIIVMDKGSFINHVD